MFFDEQAQNVLPLNEVYFGKTKEILRIEKALDSFRNKHMGDYFPVHVNSDPDLFEIDRMFEKQFGFGCFCLYIVNQPAPNAFTFPLDMRFDVKTFGKNDELIVDEKNFKFNPKSDYACIVGINSGLIFNSDYTTAEVLALILHEIGHNFFASLNRKNGVLCAIFKVLVFIAAITNNITLVFAYSNTIDSIVTKTSRELREKGSLLTDIMDIINFTRGLIITFIGTIFSIENLFTFNFLKLINHLKWALQRAINPFTYVVLPINYRNERAADNFPSIYGYGPELASALNKFQSSTVSTNTVNNTLSYIPIISTLFNMVALPGEIIATAFDEHPEGITRAQDQLAMLSRELDKNDIDPKTRKVIKADIKAIQAQLDNYIDTSKGFNDPDLGRHVYNRIMYSLTNSKTFKDFLLDDRHKFEEYDKTFYEQLDKTSK